jgi:hypothetical protein
MCSVVATRSTTSANCGSTVPASTAELTLLHRVEERSVRTKPAWPLAARAFACHRHSRRHVVPRMRVGLVGVTRSNAGRPRWA